MVLLPRASSELIASVSKHVTISMAGVEKTATAIQAGYSAQKYDVQKWKLHELHPKVMDSTAIDWIFLVDTLNFSFWSEEGKEYCIKFNGKPYTGYWSLCAAVNRALQEGYSMTSSLFFSNVSLKKLKHIFRSETSFEIPLLNERHRILHETGKCLNEKFGGSFINVLASCNNSAQKLVEIVTENFPSYRDEAEIDGHKVSLYKRAQILVADIWACFEGQGYGLFHDIDTLTMFADYRVPQVLLYFGALEYSEELLHKLNDGVLMENGERFEVEIRGCSIWAVELICQSLKKCQSQPYQTSVINPILIDFYLWDYRRNHAEEMKQIPFHRTRCIYY